MILQGVFAIILLGHIRKWIKDTEAFNRFNVLIWCAMALAIIIPTLYISLGNSNVYLAWAGHLLIAVLWYIIVSNKILKPIKPLLYAFLPLLVLDILKDALHLTVPTFFLTWENYFEIGSLIAFFWMIAALIFSNRQRKALAAERLKAEQKEREYQITERIKADLEVQVRERTNELVGQKEELQQTLNELKSTQSQLIQSEKMASLGELTAGIAHEIQNPLNFVNNFSDVSKELIDEILVENQKSKADRDDDLISGILSDIKDNLEKINHHGRRADAIVKGMLQHSRSSSDTKEPTDINKLAEEYFRLAYHGLRAKDKTFNATLETDFDQGIGVVNIVPQDMGRAILNLIVNAFHATQQKKQADPLFQPVVSIITRKVENWVEISVIDNGVGIPLAIQEKILQPFFTTKPTGEGTGLGLSLSYDIVVKAHGGKISIDSVENQYSIFTISIPIK